MAVNIKGLCLSLAVFSFSTLSLHGASAQDVPPRAQNEGSSAALRDNALQLVYSSPGVGDDTRRGVELLTQLAEQGDVEASIALGDLYLYGTLLPRDWDKALQFYESAADAGNGRGIYNYGTMLMWEERDASLAETMLVRAGEMGVAEAWATLAEGAMYGYLGDDSISQAKFDGFAERGFAEGVDRIAVLEATRYLQGISVAASGARALEILEDAVDQGNAEALRFLIRLVRDGESGDIPADRLRALNLLESYRPLLQNIEFEQLKLTIIAALSNTIPSFERLARDLKERSDVITVDFVRDLMDANPEALTFLLQSNLAFATEDGAPVTGIANSDNPLFRGARISADRNIVEYALDSADHTTFVAALQKAGLVDMLWTEGPFTVFAPTNSAFNALPEGDLETLLLEENRETLTMVLSSHIVAGKISAAELASRARASSDRFYHFKAISGAALSAQARRSGRVYIFDENGNAYRISAAGADQSNGVIHVVEGVLLPR